jgi:hypothetical protein
MTTEAITDILQEHRAHLARRLAEAAAHMAEAAGATDYERDEELGKVYGLIDATRSILYDLMQKMGVPDEYDEAVFAELYDGGQPVADLEPAAERPTPLKAPPISPEARENLRALAEPQLAPVMEAVRALMEHAAKSEEGRRLVDEINQKLSFRAAMLRDDSEEPPGG